MENSTLPSPNLVVESREGYYVQLNREWHGHDRNHPLVGATAYEYRMTTTSGDYPAGGGWRSVGEIFTPPKTSHRVRGLENGTWYYFQLRAWNGTIAGNPSLEASVVYGSGEPAAVTEVRAVHRGSTLEVSWDAAEGADTYHVTYTDANNISWQLAEREHPGTNLTINGVDSTTTYLVGVRSKNNAGYHSGWVNSAPAAPPALSVADATVAEPGEGQSATLDFLVTLNRATSAAVTVDHATSNGTATAGADYTAASGTLSFAVGETEKTVSVTVLHDSHDESSETLTLTLSNAQGAVIDDGLASGTITNDGPIPQAWLARFGRAVAHQVFDVTAATAGADLTWSVWGQGAVTNFDGRDGGVTLDGTVTTALLGADWTWGQATTPEGEAAGEECWRAGLLLSHSTGEGRYDGTTAHGDNGSPPPGTAGTVKARLTGFFPWLRHALSNRLTAWGVAGYGQGTLTATPTQADHQTAAALKADLNLWLAAGGLHGTLLEGGTDGLTLTGPPMPSWWPPPPTRPQVTAAIWQRPRPW